RDRHAPSRLHVRSRRCGDRWPPPSWDQVDVFIIGGFPTALACKVANVPTVVYIGAGDPVATRLIDSLAHPGGNITGISDNATVLATKRLGLINQAVPKVRRVALFC